MQRFSVNLIASADNNPDACLFMTAPNESEKTFDIYNAKNETTGSINLKVIDKISFAIQNKNQGSRLSDRINIKIIKLLVDSVEHIHIHCTSWPDGTAISPAALTLLVKIIRDHSPNPAEPIQINCIAGVGRTGTLIMSDLILMTRTIKKATQLDDTIVSLRMKRGNQFVSSRSQYVVLRKLLENKDQLKDNLEL